MNRAKFLGALVLASATSTNIFAGIFGDRLALGIAGNMGARQWDIDQQSTLKASPFTTTKSAYAGDFKTLGFGILAAIETTQPGFSITPTAIITFDGTSEVTVGANKVSNAEQFNMTAMTTVDFAYNLGFLAPFASAGVVYSAMGEVMIDGKVAAPNLSYNSLGAIAGGGLKIYIGDKFFLRGAYHQQLVEVFGSRGRPEDSAATATYVLSRSFVSGSNITISANYIFSGSETPEAKPAPTEVQPATPEVVKPAEAKPANGKKKNR